MKIPLIQGVVAMDIDNVIGKNGTLPWKMAIDMKRFRMLTLEKTIVMGRKTYESIGHPLPNRKIIVMTHDNNWRGEKWDETCRTTQSIDEAILSSETNKLMIVGGADIYKIFLPYMDSIHVTMIDAHTKGDIVFPKIEKKYKKNIIESHKKNEKNDYDCQFEEWIFD